MSGCVLFPATNKNKNKINWKCEIFGNLVSSLFGFLISARRGLFLSVDKIFRVKLFLINIIPDLFQSIQ